ncbi:MAG: hypothetical protein AB7N76_14905 [Planctomycetota bacterium]
MSARAPRLLLLAALGALAACSSPPPASPPAQAASDPPGPTEVRQAYARLHDGLSQLAGWPPEHLTRSRPFPELPLVRLAALEDRGAWGVEVPVLQRTLEKAVQDGHLLRLDRDERAVPEFLREEGSPPPAAPSLELSSWAGRDGRLHLELRDLVKEGVLLAVESDVAERPPRAGP